MLDGARDAQNNMRAFADVHAMGKVVDVPAARGDLILFSNLVMHGSGKNNSPDVRWSLDWRVHAAPTADRLGVGEKEAAATAWWGSRAWWSWSPDRPAPTFADWLRADPVSPSAQSCHIAPLRPRTRRVTWRVGPGWARGRGRARQGHPIRFEYGEGWGARQRGAAVSVCVRKCEKIRAPLWVNEPLVPHRFPPLWFPFPERSQRPVRWSLSAPLV